MLQSANENWTQPAEAPWTGLERRGDAAGAVLRAGFDALGVAVAVFDARGQLRHANAGARQRLDQGRVRLPLGSLERVCEGGRRLLVELDGGEMIALQPLEVGAETLAVATFSLPALADGVALQLYAQQRGLTGAESRVLAQLSEGRSATEIADHFGVAHCTVLSHISAVRAKTGCRSVRQLLNRLAAIPPLAGRTLYRRAAGELAA